MGVTENDLYGCFLIEGPIKGELVGYYDTLQRLYSLLYSEEWKNGVTGFYVNAAHYVFARICYFCKPQISPKPVVEAFLRDHGLHFHFDPEPPSPRQVSEKYGGEELHFRRYLALYTLIGLEIIQADLDHCRCLFATFRWQVFREEADYRTHFLPTFQEFSPTFRSLSGQDKEQFWNDLSHWPDPREVDWAHMFVNMVLGFDWNRWLVQLYREPKYSIAQINQRMLNPGFQIPEQWSPKLGNG